MMANQPGACGHTRAKNPSCHRTQGGSLGERVSPFQFRSALTVGKLLDILHSILCSISSLILVLGPLSSHQPIPLAPGLSATSESLLSEFLPACLHSTREACPSVQDTPQGPPSPHHLPPSFPLLTPTAHSHQAADNSILKSLLTRVAAGLSGSLLHFIWFSDFGFCP